MAWNNIIELKFYAFMQCCESRMIYSGSGHGFLKFWIRNRILPKLLNKHIRKLKKMFQSIKKKSIKYCTVYAIFFSTIKMLKNIYF